MGGAERTARKRRQQQLAARNDGGKAVAAARRGGDGKRIAVIVGVVVAVLAVVIGGLVWTNASKNATEGQTIPTESVQADIAERRDGAVVVLGDENAPATIDVYADFLCPVCATFEQQYGQQIMQKVAQGQLQVRQHMLPMLVEQSDPPGYSMEAANAALLAADEGKFVEFHDSLFASQPEEGKRGYDKEQLIQLGRDLGITSDAFAEGVRSGKYEKLLDQEMQRVSEDTSLHQDFGGGQVGFGTPTVVANGRIVNLGDTAWLDKAVRTQAS
ncbi:DsbA family protein [Saccharomonospora cyanea]|uniref:Protein-disulfide isomerase n=1 Tax=Saccharomonospora cyanea NA-134 TaxID=882082 RepID=H5XKI6_9PSEU|nr:thioredoxin domain-containing protein [Saccharomonospora cyanea]EHR59819.1 protein-disulfide isomerase [Saccharomonospora cyanea NA-134]